MMFVLFLICGVAYGALTASAAGFHAFQVRGVDGMPAGLRGPVSCQLAQGLHIYAHTPRRRRPSACQQGINQTHVNSPSESAAPCIRILLNPLPLHHPTHGHQQALYFLSSYFNQFGPNCTTWLVAAEVFPTDVRTTFQGGWSLRRAGCICGRCLLQPLYGLGNRRPTVLHRTSFPATRHFGCVGQDWGDHCRCHLRTGQVREEHAHAVQRPAAL
jgi:hypothetical protein